MKKICITLGIGLFLFSCASNKSKTTKDSIEKASIMIPKSSCYSSISSKDTILLKLEIFPNLVTGILKYNFFEKDKSQGSIEGKLIGDTIYADYSFTSEGKTSVREVAFLIKDNKVVEGFGDMTEQNGKLIFKNRKNINFSNGTHFNPIDCVENNKKFQIKH